MSEWTIFLAIGSVLIAGAAFFWKMVDKSLSIREHEEYKKGVTAQVDLLTKRQEDRLVIREFEAFVVQVRLDVHRIEDAIKVLDQNKPTTGELDLAARALDARITALEERIKVINSRVFDAALKTSE
jgi:CHASE3 domain sensor protein